MSSFTQKYTLIQLFENIPEGTRFSMTDWPLHSTIVDVFAIDWDVHTIIEKLSKLLRGHEQASSVATEDAFFGPDEKRVVLLEKTDSLVKLHYDVVDLLDQGDFKPNNPQFMRKGFLPHSTVQKHARLNKDDIVIFNALTLIDMFPNEDPYQRKVLKTIETRAS